MFTKEPVFYLDQFFERKLRADERPAAFGYELTRLLKKGLPDLKDEASRQLILKTQFWRSLPTNMKENLILAKLLNWYKLLERADRVYDLLMERKCKRDTQSTRTFSGKCYSCGKQGHRAVDSCSNRTQYSHR